MTDRIQIETTINRESLYYLLRSFVLFDYRKHNAISKIESEGVGDASYDIADTYVNRRVKLDNSIFMDTDFSELVSIASEIITENIHQWLDSNIA